MKASVKRKCPECGRLTLERLIGIGAGFIIKGRASTPKAEAAERVSEAESQKAAASDESTTTSSAKDDSKTSSEGAKSSEKATHEKPVESQKDSGQEKKLSGSTSTPTHVAREGRGVGNLVDKARRHSRESTGKPTPKATKKKSRTSKGKTGTKPHRKKKA